MNYKKEINIDKYNLDEENRRLPTANFICHEELAEKIRERDDCKLELEVLEAEIDKEIRDKEEKKPSEPRIKNMVMMDQRRYKKVKEYMRSDEFVNKLISHQQSSPETKLAIDTLKETVPIWKKEHFSDGEVWVNSHP